MDESCSLMKDDGEIPESSNPSYWDLTEQTYEYPKWEGQQNYDVAVIGGGITGLTTALLLKEAGKKVVVLERYRIGYGTTGSTTGHINSSPDSDYRELEGKFGKEGNRLVRMAMSEGIDLIEKISQKYQIDCDLIRLPGYYYTEDRDSIQEIREEYHSSLEAGLKVKLLGRAPLPFKTQIALKICNQAQFHSLKYINGLGLAVDGNGSNIFENTHVIDYEDGEPCMIHIESMDHPLKVKSIVVATHTAIGLHILNAYVAPYRSYVIAAKTPNKYPRGLFWDTRDPYNYIRFQPDDLSSSKSDQVLIVGGFDHKTGQTKNENEHYLELEKYTRERFPIEQIYTQWSAQWYKSVDGLPYIGLSPTTSNVYMSIGYGGDGLSWGSIAAKINSDLIRGLSNPYSELFSPSRSQPVEGIVELVSENLNVAMALTQGWMRSDYTDVKNMKREEARIVQNGLQKVAVYKDENGCLYKCSAICPHMGTILKWNGAEKTWDCPAHGGRFTYDGRLIEGAPMTDLEDLGNLFLSGE